MTDYTPLTVLPNDIQNDFGAELFSATPTTKGVYRLVAAHRTQGSGYQGQRITVLVVDENGQALAGVPVAFAYSTADKYTLTSDFQWQPPGPHKAFIARTGGDGTIDQIQGSPVKQGCKVLGQGDRLEGWVIISHLPIHICGVFGRALKFTIGRVWGHYLKPIQSRLALAT